MEDLVLLNNFLGALSDSNPKASPKMFISTAAARMVALGYVIQMPEDQSQLADPFGDIYLELDRYPVFGDPLNRLQQIYGEMYYLNVTWFDDGEQIIACIVSESDLEKDDSEPEDNSDYSDDLDI